MLRATEQFPGRHQTHAELYKSVSIRTDVSLIITGGSLQFKEFHAKKQRCKASKEKELTQRTHPSLLHCSFAALRETPGSKLYSSNRLARRISPFK